MVMGRAGGTRLCRYRCYLSVLAGFTTPPLPPALPTTVALPKQGRNRLEGLEHLRISATSGGENGIRTRGTLLRYTRFPGEYHKPLGHLSKERNKTEAAQALEPQDISRSRRLRKRRARDSNPRYLAVHLISSQAPSATRTALRTSGHRAKRRPPLGRAQCSPKAGRRASHPSGPRAAVPALPVHPHAGTQKNL
jgi:hypothetical protein